MTKKKITVALFCLGLVLQGLAQSNSSTRTAPLGDLKSTNNPTFQLLDIAPSSISQPADPKELGLSLQQTISSGSALPKNFAISVAPYWYFKPAGENVYKYLNLPYAGKNHTFSGIARKLSVSVSSTFNDSTSGSLLKNTNYFAGGITTNILTIRQAKDQDTIANLLTIISSRIHTAQRQPIDSVAKFLAKDSIYVKASKDLQDAIGGMSLPLFQVDAAGAYSEAFAGNATSSSRFSRVAGWVTATLSTPLSKTHNDNLSILGLFKLMDDNLLVDTAKNTFERKSAIDIGGRLSYTNKTITIGFEFIQRSYSGASVYNSHRAVGLLQYKVNDNIYLTGSFGQNFGSSVTNLFTALGLSFGFGNKAQTLPD